MTAIQNVEDLIVRRVRVLHLGDHEHAVECRCGWQSSYHDTPDGAIRDHGRHYRLMHR